MKRDLLMHDPALPCEDAAAYLGMTARELRVLASRRELAHVRRGERGHLKFRLSELNRWLARHEVPARRSLDTAR